MQKALVHMNKMSEFGHSQVALSIKRRCFCCEWQLPSDLNRFASYLRSCVQKGRGCWTGDKSKYGARWHHRCLRRRLREEQRRARHGFSTARALPGEPTDAPNMAIKRDVEQTEKKRFPGLPNKCKHWRAYWWAFQQKCFSSRVCWVSSMKR